MKKLTLSFALLLATTTFAQIPNYVPTNGLVGWWPFNGNANDESGNGNNGTVNGATLISDRFGNANSAYSFDGVNDKINIIAQTNIPQQSDYTVSFWFNSPFSTYNGAFLSFNSWFCKLGHDSPGFFYKDEIGNSSNNFYEQAHFGVQPTVNTWNNLILKKTNNTITLILNNSIIGNMTTYGFSNFNPSSLIQIGYYCCQEYFAGSIDDIGLWNRTLTVSEILALYENCQLSITSQPQDQNVNSSVGSTSFSIATSTPTTTYQWQTNLGLGFQNLSNAGQYSGVTSSTLNVSNLSMSNNNQVLRCLINDGGCTDTSTIATLTIIDDASISETGFPLISISPNPTTGDFNIAGLELYNTISTMRVSDVNGKLVKELDPTANKFTFGSVKSGVYFLTITAVDKQEVIKIIKE
jgi:hypothetical protein